MCGPHHHPPPPLRRCRSSRPNPRANPIPHPPLRRCRSSRRTLVRRRTRTRTSRPTRRPAASPLATWRRSSSSSRPSPSEEAAGAVVGVVEAAVEGGARRLRSALPGAGRELELRRRASSAARGGAGRGVNQIPYDTVVASAAAGDAKIWQGDGMIRVTEICAREMNDR